MSRRYTKKMPYAEFCARCGEQTMLHNHHKIAVSDGGNDSDDNIVTLCSTCHGEWHVLEQSKGRGLYSFETWMQLPSYLELLAFFTNQNVNIGLGDAKVGFLKAIEIYRTFRKMKD